MSIKNILIRIVSYLENGDWPFSYILISFFSFIVIREYTEFFLTTYEYTFWQTMHYGMYYILIALIFINWLNFLTGKSVERLSRLILPFFVIIIFVPLVDLLVGWGRNFSVAYLFITSWSDMVFRYFTFFGFDWREGATPGIHLEIFLVLLVCVVYLRNNKFTWPKSILAGIGVYTFLFISSSMNFFQKTVSVFLSSETEFPNHRFAIIYVLISLPLLFRLLYLYRPVLFMAIIRDSRYERQLHFMLAVIIGSVVAFKVFGINQLVYGFLVNLILVFAAVFCGLLFSAISNNISDKEIDEISNIDRPLIAKSVAELEYKQAMWFLLVISVFLISLTGLIAVKLFLAFLGMYYIYSMPPIRAKRALLFSKLMIGANTGILTMLGFYLVKGDMQEYPVELLWFVIFGMGLAINFIDLKDYDGDRQAGIKTLPVLLGLNRSKILISVFFIIANIWSLVLFALPIWSFVPMIILTVVEVYFINKKEYRERPVFLLYLTSLIFLLLVYLLN